MPDEPSRKPDADPALDPRLEAELTRRLASIRRQTDASWKDESFFSWLWARFTLAARRKKK